MHISWNFLDKRNAAISAIEAYPGMEFILRNSAEEIEYAETKMIGLGSQTMDGMPHASNPRAGEERIIAGIERIDTIKERYRQAVEYMQWFKPAWEELSEDERYVLGVFYMDSLKSAAQLVCERFSIERSSAYNKKNRAIDHLTLLLYGKA